MKGSFDDLTFLATQFTLMSLLAIGGANAAIPEMHRLAVELRGWMTDQQFAEMYAIAQLTPGPNVIVVTLIGYHVAGVLGALVATTAMCGPTCVLAYMIGKVWDRFRHAPWRIAIQAGLVPISIGLIAASAYVLALAADRSVVAAAITLATVALGYFTRINPLWIFAGAAIIGMFGIV
jgi:chromate transporter